MDLELTPEQQELMRTVRATIERHAGDKPLPVRALDRASLDLLHAGEFLDIPAAGGDPLDAVLVIESAIRAGVCAPIAARALIAPMLGIDDAPVVVGLANGHGPSLVRFGDTADAFLTIVDDEAALVPATAADVEPVKTRWGYPVARVQLARDDRMWSGSRQSLERLWRIAIAAEAGALMAGAISVAAEHVSGRYQFGRPIGGYQAVQHRLARAHVVAEGTKWLARQAACNNEDDEMAAAAATFATEGMREVVSGTQQVSGAIGITDEFDLTRFNAPMVFLQTEMGGPRRHAITYANSRYRGGEPRRAPAYRGRGRASAAADA